MAKSNIVQIDANILTLGTQERNVYTALRNTFHDVVLFGGCLREQYIRQNAPQHSALTNDIDTRVRHAKQGIPKSIENHLNSLPLNTWTDLSSQQTHTFSDWMGMDVIRVRNRKDRWSLTTFGDSTSDQHPVDISMMKPTLNRDRLDHFILNSILVPFSAVAFSEHGFAAHRDFQNDARDMRFSISRKDGLPPVLWASFYYERLKEKYPELKIENPEVPFLRLAYRIKAFLQRQSTMQSTQTFEMARNL